MPAIITAILLLTTLLIPASTAAGATFNYRFNHTPLAKALSTISNDHPDLSITFIYNELENYNTSAVISTDNAEEALRAVIGRNPVSLYRHGSDYIIEALQHGRFRYTGRVTGTDNLPLEAATVLLLSPQDSTVITFGLTHTDGSFLIPCDKRGAIAKISYLGYKNAYMNCKDFNLGNIRLTEQPVNLKQINVAPDKATVYADRTVFIPTSRQKNASQTAVELLQRMAIPYLKAGGLAGLTTSTGSEVDLFIDFLPADGPDLTGMKMSDVKKVEYYDFPSDPRFLGKRHVVNFIMTKYEYGGYVKGYTDQNIFYNSGQFNGYSKLQYKKMTYDLRLGGYHRDDNHGGTASEETFRIPNPVAANPNADAITPDATEFTTFKRYSDVSSSDVKERLFWVTLRATYANEKTTVRNTIGGDFDNWPRNNQKGTVSYSPEIAPTEKYASKSSNKVNSLSYQGIISLFLPKGNTLTINPAFSYSHTSQFSDYQQPEVSFINRALDDTHNGSLSIGFNHRFGNRSNLRAAVFGDITGDRIVYSGTANAIDRTRSLRLSPSLAYNLPIRDLNISLSTGLQWQNYKYGDVADRNTAPWANLSLQYSFLRKNSVSFDLNYNSLLLPSHYRSDNVIRSNPLMSYTGNPFLRPEKNFSLNASYTFFPSEKFSGSVYASADMVRNRATFEYVPYEGGILRKVTQGRGRYSGQTYGAYASLSLFDNSLQLSASADFYVTRNGAPYNWTKRSFEYSLEAYYYLKAFHFDAAFISPSNQCPDRMSGVWERSRAIYYVSAGWANKAWNVRTVFNGFATFTWRNKTTLLTTPYYDRREEVYGSGHFIIKLAATYTFGFGKKVNRGDESNRVSGVKSAILK